jgi:single-strand DNA-binding protein
MNVVALIGNLASDVEVKELGGDRKVASFLLAVDRRSRDGGADFLRISAWDKQADLCSRFLSKGSRVGVDGRLRSRSWEDADGKRRSAVEVVATGLAFLSAPGQREEAPFEAAATHS